MLVAKGNKKSKIIFYIFSFIFLSTVSFLGEPKIFGNSFFFQLEKIEINGNKKINHLNMQNELNTLIGRNLLLINPKDISEIVDKNQLVSGYTIQKQYPNKVVIELKEAKFVAKLLKDQLKYYLADNGNLILSTSSLSEENLPNIYGKGAEHYFNNFQKTLRINNFDLSIVSSYYFFQINRWDIVLNNQKTIKFPPQNLEEAIRIANRILKDDDFDKYSVIDLRIKNKIITK